MKKIFLLSVLLFIFTAGFYGEENILQKSASVESGIELFLNNNLGKEVYVCISGMDVTIFGVLKSVYNDSIIVETVFKNEVMIPRTSIAYIRLNILKKQ